MNLSTLYGPQTSRWIFPLAAILCAVGMWTYVDRVLIPEQIRYDAAHGASRGNFSDLYPRWLGARELLLHGRDPYSAEITLESQTGFYGRPLAPDQPGNRNYQQGFYYPVYIAFYVAPSIHLPFDTVRRGFFWILFILTVITIPLWPRVLRWPIPLWAQASLVIFTIGSLPVVQGLKLQQMTLLVAALLAVAAVLLTTDHPLPAGVLLALATIKPQLVGLLLLWLTLWTLSDWRRRYRWAVSFLVTMTILCVASEWYLPHWIPRFVQALREYRSYTGEMSVMNELVGVPWSWAIEFLAMAGTAVACWREHRQPADSDAFAFIVGLILAMTVLVVPTYGPYNQVLLVPAMLIMLRKKGRRSIWQRSLANRVLSFITISLICWPWISSITLAGLSFILRPETVERGWALPFWTTLQIPLAVAGLMLLHYYQSAFTAPGKPGTS
jgi:hypothetical protein